MGEEEQKTKGKISPGSALREIKNELREQSVKLEAMEAQLLKIKNMLVVGKVFSVLKFLLLIVLPIVLSIIYLPPLLESFIGQYEAVLDQYQGIQLPIDNLPFIN